MEGRNEGYQELGKRIEQLKKESNEASFALGRMKGAVAGNKLAANDAQKATSEATRALEKSSDMQLEMEKLKLQASSEQIDERVKEIDLQKKSIRAQLDSLSTLDQTNQDVKDRTKELTKQFGDLNTEQEMLNGSVKTAVELREREQKGLEKFKELIKGAIDARIKAIEGEVDVTIESARQIKSASAESIKDRLEEIKTERAAREAALPGLQAVAAVSEEGRDKLKEYQESLQKLKEEEYRLTNSVLPLVQAREDEEKAIEAQKQALRDRIDDLNKEVDIEVQTANQMKEASSESLKSRLDEIEVERKALQQRLVIMEALAGDDEESLRKVEEAKKKIAELNAEQGRISTTILPAVQAREAEKDAIDRTKEASEKYQDQLDKIADIETEIAQTRKEHEDDIRKTNADRAFQAKRDEEDFNRSRFKAVTDFNKGLAEDEVEHFKSRGKSIEDFNKESNEEQKDNDKARLKELEEFNKESLRNAEDFQERLQKIEEDSRIEITDAASELDAKAVYQAMRNREKQIKDETASYDKDKRRREEDFQARLKEEDDNIQESRSKRLQSFQQQLQDEDTQYNEQRAKRIAEFNAQLAEEDEERAFRAARQLEDEQRQDAEREAAFQAQIAKLQANLGQEQALRDQYQSDQVQIMQQFYGKLGQIARDTLQLANDTKNQTNDILNQARNAASQSRMVAGGSSSGQMSYSDSQGGKLIRYRSASKYGYAGGGTPPTNTPVLVGEQGPELAVFGQSTRIFDSGATSQMLNGFSGGSNSFEFDMSNMSMSFGDIGNKSPQDVENMVFNAMMRVFKKIPTTTGRLTNK
jgi:hypothetical protein